MRALVRLIFYWVALVGTGISISGAGVQWGQPVGGVQLGLEIEDRTFQLGEKLPLSIKFTNSTAMPRFPAGPVHFGCPISVQNERGESVPRREDLRRETQAKAAGQPAPAPMRPPPMYGTPIKPGGTLGFAADLLRDFAIDEPGKYRVSAAGQVLTGMPFAPGSVPQPIVSPTVVVQVITNLSPKPVVAYSPLLALKSQSNAPPPVVVQAAAPEVKDRPAPKPSVPEQTPVPVAAAPSSRFSPAAVGAIVFGCLGLLVLYFMFRPGPR